MPRKTDLNILTLLICMTIAVALTTGCESKPSKPGGNTSTATDTNANAAKTAASDDHDATDTGADTSISDDDSHDDHDGHDHDGHDHDGHDHGDHDGHDHGDAAHSDNDGAASADVIDLGKDKIARRPSGIRPTNKRDATGDMIYATVRVQMDILIAERKELLDGGMDPTDPEVRQKETSIRKAVSLLTQNGEIVGPIDPPIDGLDLPEND